MSNYDFWEEQEMAEQEYDAHQQEIADAFENGFQQGKADERKYLEIAFNRLFGSEYSWWEVVELAEQLKENSND